MTYKFNNKEFDNKNWNIISPMWLSYLDALDDYYSTAFAVGPLADILRELDLLPFNNVINPGLFRTIFYELILTFNKMGTNEQYIYLMKLFFGNTATINIEWVAPGFIRINVDNVDQFFYYWINEVSDNIVDDEAENIILFENILNLNDYDLNKLIRDITPAGGVCDLVITL